MGTPYIKSHPDFLKEFKHGDTVFCFEVKDWHESVQKLLDNFSTSNDLLLDILEEIIIIENEEDLKNLQKRAKKLHLRLNK